MSALPPAPDPSPHPRRAGRTPLEVVDGWVIDPRIRRDALIGFAMFLLAFTASIGLLANASTITISAAAALMVGTGAVIRRQRRRRAQSVRRHSSTPPPPSQTKTSIPRRPQAEHKPPR